MEQTLGKRIAKHRKGLGITQDQLAEKLGITAQAVSKWENDQSCPDITVLPRLAEIFGTTTDALLGCEPETPAHEAQVVEDNEKHDLKFSMDPNDGKNDWTFHWDSGRWGSLTFAVWVLLCGGLLLAASLLDWDVGFWEILWPSGLLVFGLSGLLRRFSFFSLGATLFGAYFLADYLELLPFQFGKEILLPVFLLLFGLSLLADALRKPNKPVFRFTHNGRDASKTSYQCSCDTDRFSCSLSFGEKRHPVSLPVLSGGDATVSFGEMAVDLTGVERVSENCFVDATCSFGELKLLVPRRFRVEPRADTAFAAVNVKGHPAPEAEGIIFLDANASFGQIEIRYI